MKMLEHKDTSATETSSQIVVAPPHGQEMGSGPLDGLRVLDLVGFMVVELAVAVVSGPGSLLADAGRRLTDVGALFASVLALRQQVADDSSAAGRAEREAIDCSPG
jgi:hypothetical protein